MKTMRRFYGGLISFESSPTSFPSVGHGTEYRVNPHNRYLFAKAKVLDTLADSGEHLCTARESPWFLVSRAGLTRPYAGSDTHTQAIPGQPRSFVDSLAKSRIL